MKYQDLAVKDLSGKIWFMPTDTIPGLSCLASDAEAQKRIYTLKQRPSDKVFIMLCADLNQVKEIQDIGKHEEFLNKVWPGRVSVAFGEQSAIRVPDNVELQEFLSIVGPVVSTSCNISGEPTIVEKDKAQEVFGDMIDYYLDATIQDNASSSTIIKIIR